MSRDVENSQFYCIKIKVETRKTSITNRKFQIYMILSLLYIKENRVLKNLRN